MTPVGLTTPSPLIEPTTTATKATLNFQNSSIGLSSSSNPLPGRISLVQAPRGFSSQEIYSALKFGLESTYFPINTWAKTPNFSVMEEVLAKCSEADFLRIFTKALNFSCDYLLEIFLRSDFAYLIPKEQLHHTLWSALHLRKTAILNALARPSLFLRISTSEIGSALTYCATKGHYDYVKEAVRPKSLIFEALEPGHFHITLLQSISNRRLKVANLLLQPHVVHKIVESDFGSFSGLVQSVVRRYKQALRQKDEKLANFLKKVHERLMQPFNDRA